MKCAHEQPVPRNLKLPYAFGILIVDATGTLVLEAGRRFRRSSVTSRGTTLRPGHGTPLWNIVRRQLKPYLARYGDQTKLARTLGLPRQRINEFVTGGGRMPDAERTLQLIVWLLGVRRARWRAERTHRARAKLTRARLSPNPRLARARS